MPSPRAYVATAVVGDKIYVTGGEEYPTSGSASGVSVLDTRSGRWSPSEQMPSSRSHGGIAVFGGRIWVAGGTGGEGDAALRSVESFLPASGSWRAEPELPWAGSYEAKRHGLFTYYLLKGLGGQAARGKHLDVSSLYEYVRSGVRRQAHRENREQDPQLQTGEPGLRLY